MFTFVACLEKLNIFKTKKRSKMRFTGFDWLRKVPYFQFKEQPFEKKMYQLWVVQFPQFQSWLKLAFL